MMSLLLAATGGVEQVQGSLSTLEKSILGAILVVSWGITIIAIWQLIKVQNARVDDQKAAAAASNKLVEKLTETMSETRSAIDKNREADANTAQALNSMQTSFQMYVMSRSRNFTPAAMPAVREQKK